jgi:hypothetical protein
MIHHRFISQLRLHPSPDPENIAPFGNRRIPGVVDCGFRIPFDFIPPFRCRTRVERALKRKGSLGGKLYLQLSENPAILRRLGHQSCAVSSQVLAAVHYPLIRSTPFGTYRDPFGAFCDAKHLASMRLDPVTASAKKYSIGAKRKKHT